MKTEKNMEKPEKEETKPISNDKEQKKEEEANDSSSISPKPGDGYSSFLRKQILARGHRFFDSGDYQMAKQKNENQHDNSSTFVSQSTGNEIPTPDTVPKRKVSISKLALLKF